MVCCQFGPVFVGAGNQHWAVAGELDSHLSSYATLNGALQSKRISGKQAMRQATGEAKKNRFRSFIHWTSTSVALGSRFAKSCTRQRPLAPWTGHAFWLSGSHRQQCKKGNGHAGLVRKPRGYQNSWGSKSASLELQLVTLLELFLGCLHESQARLPDNSTISLPHPAKGLAFLAQTFLNATSALCLCTSATVHPSKIEVILVVSLQTPPPTKKTKQKRYDPKKGTDPCPNLGSSSVSRPAGVGASSCPAPVSVSRVVFVYFWGGSWQRCWCATVGMLLFALWGLCWCFFAF